MKVSNISLSNFRSHKNLKLKLAENTIIIGENAEGKTNFLEAIYICSVGKSYRAKEKELISWDEDYFRIEAETENERKEKIEMIFEKNVGNGRKTVKINGAKRASSALLSTLKCIFFSPEEIDMFFSFPAVRRRHFNIFISQTESDYQRQLIQYSKALDQRNSLLRLIREGRAKENDLEVWDGKLAEHGAKIIEKRQEIVSELNAHLADEYKKISGNGGVLVLNYKPALKNKLKKEAWGPFLESLLESRKVDILSGVTNVGPHRDDFDFTLGSRPLTSFASRGEFRSGILSLKLAEAKVLEKKTGIMPVLLLDDVFSELDEKRRKYLAETFAGQQTIVTTTDLDHIDKNLAQKALIYKIENKKVKAI